MRCPVFMQAFDFLGVSRFYAIGRDAALATIRRYGTAIIVCDNQEKNCHICFKELDFKKVRQSGGLYRFHVVDVAVVFFGPIAALFLFNSQQKELKQTCEENKNKTIRRVYYAYILYRKA